MQPEIKSLTLDVKAFGDGETGGFEAILSTKAVDRDGETVEPGAFNPLPASIPIYHAHGWTKGDKPIGKGEPFYDGDILKVKGTWAPTADGQEMRELVNGGFINSMSAGFLTRDRKGKSIRVGELIEGSMTGIPINTQSLVLSSKDLAALITADAGRAIEALAQVGEMEMKAGARNNKSDASMIQAIHDHASTLGAMCAPVEAKSVTTTDLPEVTVKAEEAADTAAAEPAAASTADELERLRQRARVWSYTA